MEYNHRRIVLRKKLVDQNDWESEEDGIVLEDTSNVKVSIGLGKKRDSFSFDVRSPNNSLYEQFFNGGSSDYTLKYSPIPTNHLSGTTQKFFVYVNSVLKTYSTDYTVSGSTLHFNSTPSSGNRNIRVVYPIVEADDLVDIYFWQDTDFSSLTDEQKNSARKLEGTITEPGLSKGNNIVNVRGYGIIDIIFSGMAFALTDQTNKRADEIIQQVINQLVQFNSNRPIVWDPGNSQGTINTNYSSKYRPAIEIIEDLSADGYTGNGQYIYWVQYDPNNNDYRFYWKSKPTDVSQIIDEGSDITNIKISRAVDGVINIIIGNVGNDCYGNGQEYLYYDFTITGYGARWGHKENHATISKEIISNEQNANSSYFDTGDDDEPTSPFPNNYNNSGGGYWNFQFTPRTSRTDPTFSTSAAKNVTTNKGYNNEIRIESYWRGKDSYQKDIYLYSNPRFKATLSIPYYMGISPILGDLYQINIPAFNLEGKKLRLTQIDYELNTIILNLEEDETTLED